MIVVLGGGCDRSYQQRIKEKGKNRYSQYERREGSTEGDMSLRKRFLEMGKIYLNVNWKR